MRRSRQCAWRFRRLSGAEVCGGRGRAAGRVQRALPGVPRDGGEACAALGAGLSASSPVCSAAGRQGSVGRAARMSCKRLAKELTRGYDIGMRNRLFTCLLLGLVSAVALPELSAQSADVTEQERDVVRVLRHPDGTRSFYKRQAGWKGMQCATYTASGKLAAINDYTEGRYGQLMGCVIYNNKREVIYKVSYGYDRKARLIEERMYSYPEQKLVQRVIYKYDARGKRSKPLIISLNPNAAAIAPTMDEDATRMHQELNRRGGRR